MMLLTKAIRQKLEANHKATRDAQTAGKIEPDHVPVVKFFSPVGAATWLFTELAEDGDTLFGLCDMGFGCPELGSVSLAELSKVRLHMGLKIERDRWFNASEKTLGDFTEAAQEKGRIEA